MKDDALADFAGALGGGLVLKIADDATLDTSAVTVDPSVDLVLSAGAILDLGGGTLTVHDVSGSGWVKNGTLVVLGADNRRSPATVIIFR